MTLAGPIDTLDVPAMANEFTHSLPAYQAPTAHYDWTGFYIGAHIDDVWSRSSASTLDMVSGASIAPLTVNLSEWRGGLQFGFDYMLPSRVVVGASADLTSGGKRQINIADANGVAAFQSNVFDTESVRGRLGLAIENLLLYGTGGWGWSNNQSVRTQLSGTFNLATAGTDEAVTATSADGRWAAVPRMRLPRIGIRSSSIALRAMARLISSCRFRRFRPHRKPPSARSMSG